MNSLIFFKLNFKTRQEYDANVSKILLSIFTNVCNYFRPALFEGVQCMQQNCALFFLVINFCSSIWTFCKENLLCSFLCKRPYCKTCSSFLLEFAEKKKQNKRNKTKRKTVTWIELIEDK